MKQPERIVFQIEFREIRDAIKALRALTNSIQESENAKWRGVEVKGETQSSIGFATDREK